MTAPESQVFTIPALPVSTRALTDYPEALDAPRTGGTPSGTASRMAALLRGREED
jgi:hypothetical protein